MSNHIISQKKKKSERAYLDNWRPFFLLSYDYKIQRVTKMEYVEMRHF